MNTYSLYIHTFPNGKRYIGITSAKDPSKRWKNGNGYKLQPLMNNAIQKYGWENVIHEIRLTGLTREEACKREQFYISLFRSTDSKYGYNITKGGESNNQGKNSGSKEYARFHNSKSYQIHKEERQKKINQYNETHKEKNRERDRNYYWTHREERLEKTKQYIALHKEERREKDRQHYQQNKERLKELARERYEQHKEEIKAKAREQYRKKKNSIKPSE